MFLKLVRLINYGRNAQCLLVGRFCSNWNSNGLVCSETCSLFLPCELLSPCRDTAACWCWGTLCRLEAVRGWVGAHLHLKGKPVQRELWEDDQPEPMAHAPWDLPYRHKQSEVLFHPAYQSPGAQRFPQTLQWIAPKYLEQLHGLLNAKCVTDQQKHHSSIILSHQIQKAQTRQLEGVWRIKTWHGRGLYWFQVRKWKEKWIPFITVPVTSESVQVLSTSPSSWPSAFCWVCWRLSLWQTSKAWPTVRTIRMAWL